MAKFTNREAGSPNWKILHGLADAAEPAIRRAFIQAIEQSRDGLPMRQVQAAIAQGNFAEAFRIAEQTWDTGSSAFRSQFTDASLRLIQRIATSEVASRLIPGRTEIRFDFLNSRAIDFARRFTGQAFTELTLNVKTGIRAAVARSFAEGTGPLVSAREIRSLIGLTERQVKTVANYRAQLQRLAQRPLEQIAETTRDRLRRAGVDILPKRGMTPARIDSLVQRYERKLIADSAETIARTATIEAAANGQQAVWLESVQQQLIDPAVWEVSWIITPDDRLCPQCARMKDARRPIDGIYGNGQRMPPLHPRCRCAEGLVQKVQRRAA